MAKKVQIDIIAKDKASKQMKTIGKSASTMGAQVKKAGLAIVAMGAAVGVAMGKAVKDWAAAGNEVHKMALRTGFATEALSEYKHALEISGASLESMDKGVKRMSKTIVDASEGMATYIRAFDRIGLSAEDLMALAPEKQFDKIAMAIAALESPTLRAATAQDIFGRAGTQLLPMLDAGADGIARLKQEAHDLGIVFDQESADKAALFTDEMDRLGKAIDGVKFSLAEELSPTLITVIGLFKDLIKGEIWISDQSKAYSKVLEGQRKIGIEYLKVLRGEESQYKIVAQAQLENIDNYLSLTTESNEYTAALARARAHLESYLVQMQAYDESVTKQTASLAAQKEQIEANKKVREEFLKVLEKEIERTRELMEARRRAAAIRLAGMGRIMEQITAAGGQISPERIRAYYEAMEREAAIQRHRAQFGERQIQFGGGGLGDIYLDGEKVGEVTSRRMGESFLQESHMSGGD